MSFLSGPLGGAVQSLGSDVAGAAGFTVQAGQSSIGPMNTEGVNVKTTPGSYTLGQLEALWVYAGGSSASAPIAAAIAMAESTGRSDATNLNKNGSIDRGLWQINSVHGAQSTTDPLANAKAAVAISNNGTDWNPWTTYGGGSSTAPYRQFLKAAETAWGQVNSLNNPLGNVIAQGATAITSPLSAITAIWIWLTTPSHWLRILEFVGGAVLLLVALKSLLGVDIPAMPVPVG